jgi:NAD-dependent deacetylase
MKRIVVFTGAGISAESGLKTFRDADGLWEGYKVTDVATPTAWKKDPAMVLQFYNERRRGILAAKPNQAHAIIAGWQSDFDVHVITQNIDDLHERAGSKNVLHLHGEIFKMRSEADENKIYPIFADIHLGDVAEDGYQLRPHIVWFNEQVPMIVPAIALTETADLFIVIGTSLLVYPAASLLRYVSPIASVYIVDKKIPERTAINYVTIEQPATKGLQLVDNLLREKFA